MHYYQHDLALVHDRGYGQHADRCAPGILELLAPAEGGLVLELGCGSGALTRHLLAAGHRVIATDASPDMLALARSALGEQADLRLLTLPGDALPAADAIVSVGHVISYVPDARRRARSAPQPRAPRERAGRHVPDPGAAGRLRRPGHGRDVVRRRGAPARPAGSNRPEEPGVIPSPWAKTTR